LLQLLLHIRILLHPRRVDHLLLLSLAEHDIVEELREGVLSIRLVARVTGTACVNVTESHLRINIMTFDRDYIVPI
jgi:hypothetical protein